MEARLTLNWRWYDFVPVSFCKLLRARGMQAFGAFGTNVAFERAINRLSDSITLGDIAV